MNRQEELMKMMRMKTWVAAGGATIAVAAAAVVVPLSAGASAPTKSSSSLTSFHGTVTSVSTTNRTFRLKRAGGATLTFRVTSATVYERLRGLSSLRGKAVEVKGRRTDGHWTARKVERDDDGANHDAGDDHGGDRGGSDDGAGHDVGDDKGGTRGGSDDGANHDAGDDHGGDRGGHGSDD
jgi:hypothetical protein